MAPGGLLLIVTDHWDYFRQIHQVLDVAAGLARVRFPQMADVSGQDGAEWYGRPGHDPTGETPVLRSRAGRPCYVGTNFERKYIAQGRPFHRIATMRYA